MSHLRDTPPCLLLRMIRPPRRQGVREAKGRVGWVQRPDRSRPWFHKLERTHSAKGNSSRDSSSSQEAPDTAGNLGSVTPARETGRKKPHTAHCRDPLWSQLNGGWRLKGDGAGFPLGVDPQLQPGGMWPNEVVAMARWSHSHSGLRPLRHHDRSLPLYKPSQNQVLASLQEASVPRPGLLEAGPHLWPPSGTGSGGAGRAHRPGENRFTQERSAGVREAFHRERGGEPKASSTRRRACTGGQRQSYKRVGYLTRSSG